jgi:hypothetical protein
MYAQYAKEKLRVESEIGRENELSVLLERFGGLRLSSGITCRNCQRKLSTLNDKCTDFYIMCQNAAVRLKRLSTSPQNSAQAKRKRMPAMWSLLNQA